MDRFDCRGALIISVSRENGDSLRQRISIQLEHHVHHVPYYNVQLPVAARKMIKNNLWAIPSALAVKIQEDFPHISAEQIHWTWLMFRDIMWKRSEIQTESTRLLLEGMEDETDIFTITCNPGV